MVMEIGYFSISLAQTGRMPHRSAASGNTPMPSKRLPNVIMAGRPHQEMRPTVGRISTAFSRPGVVAIRR